MVTSSRMLVLTTSRGLCYLALLLFVVSVGWRAFRWSVPPDIQAIYETGAEALKKKDLGGAYVSLEALEGVQPKPPQAYLLEGEALMQQGNLAGAVQVLAQALPHPQTKAKANLLAGEALYKNSQFEQSIQALEAALEADASLTDAYRLLGAAYYDLGATEPAIRALKMVNSQAPDDPRPHRLMAIIYQDMESYDEAVKQYKEVLRLAPEHPERAELLSDLADCLLKVGKYQELESLLPDCPLTPRVLVIAASSKNALGNAPAAVSLVDEALKIDPKFIEALLLKATLELEKNNVASAIQLLQTAVESNPFEYRAHYQLSQAYARNGNTDLAEKQATEANRLRDLRAHFTDLHARASIDIKNADLRFELATTAEQLGLPELAASWLAGALAIDPKHPAASEAIRKFSQPGHAEANPPGLK